MCPGERARRDITAISHLKRGRGREDKADTEARDDDKRTPLLLASGRGHVQVALALLERGANLEAQDYNKRTSLFQAVAGGHVELVRILLEHGADKEARYGNGTSPLEQALMVGRVDIAEVLLEHDADVNAQDSQNRTPLHLARGEEIVRLLLKHGADAYVLTIYARIYGHTPLHYVSFLGCVRAARLISSMV